MKVGMIHFGTLTAGSHFILQSMITFSLRKGFHLYGIQWNQEEMLPDTKLLNEDTLIKWESSREVILACFPKDCPIEYHLTLAEEINHFDSVIVLGSLSTSLKDYISETKVLEVPISIFNDINGSEMTLGYDTALNGIVNNILKIQDTISSLLYSKPRVFCVQIPGKSLNPLLENVAYAIDGHIVINGSDENGMKLLIEKIKNQYNHGKNFILVIINDTVNPNEIQDYLLKVMDVDYKWNTIDESQCVGPFPTAADRLLSIYLMENIVKWIESHPSTNRLLIKGNKVVLEQN